MWTPFVSKVTKCYCWTKIYTRELLPYGAISVDYTSTLQTFILIVKHVKKIIANHVLKGITERKQKKSLD